MVYKPTTISGGAHLVVYHHFTPLQKIAVCCGIPISRRRWPFSIVDGCIGQDLSPMTHAAGIKRRVIKSRMLEIVLLCKRVPPQKFHFIISSLHDFIISSYFMISSLHDFIISSYFIIFHHISSYFIIFHHISSYFIIFHHISSYFIISHPYNAGPPSWKLVCAPISLWL